MNTSLLYHIIEGAKSREGDADILCNAIQFCYEDGGIRKWGELEVPK